MGRNIQNQLLATSMDERNTASTDDRHGKTLALLFSVFAIATCGLIYELLAGTIASYLLSDSVTQFSTIIGVYLFSMGLGSYLSRYFHKDLIAVFIQIEILVGLIGGLSSLVLFMAFAELDAFRGSALLVGRAHRNPGRAGDPVGVAYPQKTSSRFPT